MKEGISYEEFCKWLKTQTNDITKDGEANRIAFEILERLTNGEKLIDGKFTKVQ